MCGDYISIEHQIEHSITVEMKSKSSGGIEVPRPTFIHVDLTTPDVITTGGVVDDLALSHPKVTSMTRNEPESNNNRLVHINDEHRTLCLTEIGSNKQSAPIIESFLHAPTRLRAAILLECFQACDDIDRFHEWFSPIVETAATLFAEHDVDSSITGIALVLFIQSRGFALEYLQLAIASFTAICVLRTSELVQHELFSVLSRAMVQVTVNQAHTIPNLIKDINVWQQNLIMVPIESISGVVDTEKMDPAMWDRSPRSSCINKIIAEFLAQLCTESHMEASMCTDLMLFWWSMPSPSNDVTERMVYTVLNIVARGGNISEITSIAQSLGTSILDGFEVHKMLTKNQLLWFCCCLGQAVQSPEWPSGELFLTQFIKLIVQRMERRRSQHGNVSPQSEDFIEMGFAMFYEWQDLLTKLRLSLNHNPAVEFQSSSSIRDNLLGLLNTDVPKSLGFEYTSQQKYVGMILSVPPEIIPIKLLKDSEEWIKLLGNCDIASYYTYIREMAFEYARCPSVSDSCLDSLYALMREDVSREPEFFDSAWIDRACSVSSEDTLLSFTELASIYLRKSHSLRTLEKLLDRLNEPGLKKFKMKLLDMLDFVLNCRDYDSDSENRLPISELQMTQAISLSSFMAWNYLFIAMTDKSEAVRQRAIKISLECLSEVHSWRFILTMAQTNSIQLTGDSLKLIGEYLKYQKQESYQKAKGNMRRIVGALLHINQVKLASYIVSANGELMPLDWLKIIGGTQSETVLNYLELTFLALSDLPNLRFPESEIKQAFDTLIELTNATDQQIRTSAIKNIVKLVKHDDNGLGQRKLIVQGLVSRAINLMLSRTKGQISQDDWMLTAGVAVDILGHTTSWGLEEQFGLKSMEALVCYILSNTNTSDFELQLKNSIIINILRLHWADEHGILPIETYNLFRSRIRLGLLSPEALLSVHSLVKTTSAEHKFLNLIVGDLDSLVNLAFVSNNTASLKLIIDMLREGVIGPDLVTVPAINGCMSTLEDTAELSFVAFDVLCNKHLKSVISSFASTVGTKTATPHFQKQLRKMWCRLRNESNKVAMKIVSDMCNVPTPPNIRTICGFIAITTNMGLHAAERQVIYKSAVQRLRLFPSNEPSDENNVKRALIHMFKKWLQPEKPEYPFGDPFLIAERLSNDPGETQLQIDELETESFI